MSRSRTVETHLGQLRELQEIIASMKTLSQLELHKLAGLSASQHALTENLGRIAADFYHHYPQPPAPEEAVSLWLVLGSERGFCGDFNEGLVHRLQQDFPDCSTHPQRVLAVGRKLWLRMEEMLPGFMPLEGANVSEELPRILTSVVGSIQQRMAEEEAGTLQVLYHDDQRGRIETHQMLPPELSVEGDVWRSPPLLQLSPLEFLTQFLQHYLYLGLNQRFAVSLLAENQYRVQHLEGAVRRLDERLVELSSRARSLRQEEITEEIEMILLGTGVFSPLGQS
jgi:F-type H+-transporting ATPase subunit gamma